MKIVITPQGFKGNPSAFQVAQAIDNGIKLVVPGSVTTLKPMADGGEGIVQALVVLWSTRRLFSRHSSHARFLPLRWM